MNQFFFHALVMDRQVYMRPDWAVRALCLVHGTTQPWTQYADMLVFRGTLGWHEARLDLDVRTSDFHGLRVHRGILALYHEAAASCDAPDLVCGYSCGGALAVLHAVDRAARGTRPCDDVVSIAAPAFVHPDSTDRLAELLGDTRVWRVHNERDAITRLPPHLTHVGISIPLRSATGSLVHAHMSETYVRLLLADELDQKMDGYGAPPRALRP